MLTISQTKKKFYDRQLKPPPSLDQTTQFRESHSIHIRIFNSPYLVTHYLREYLLSQWDNRYEDAGWQNVHIRKQSSIISGHQILQIPALILVISGQYSLYPSANDEMFGTETRAVYMSIQKDATVCKELMNLLYLHKHPFSCLQTNYLWTPIFQSNRQLISRNMGLFYLIDTVFIENQSSAPYHSLAL